MILKSGLARSVTLRCSAQRAEPRRADGPSAQTASFEARLRRAPQDDAQCGQPNSSYSEGANMAYVAKRGKNRCPTHPGSLLRDDIIPATGRTKAEIAGLLGISRQHLYDILQEKNRCPPAIAVR